MNNKDKDDSGVFKSAGEELSDKTLELMMFREMITNPDFMGRLSMVVDFRWFRTPIIRVMSEIAVLYWRKYGGLVTRDLVDSVLQKRNESQLIEANKVDITQALFDFNKAKDLNLGSSLESDETRIAKIEAYVKQEAMRNALLDAATSLEKRNTDQIVMETLKKFEDIQKILFEKMDFGVELSNDEIDDSIQDHIDYLVNPTARISTGWNCLDEITHGGFLKDGKSLYIFMAQAGLGKSNMLANLGYNFLKQGLKVMVISMEMSQNVYLRRFDSLISKIDIDDLGLSTFAQTLRDKMEKFFKVEHPDARLLVKEFPPNSKSSRGIEQFMEDTIEKKGWKPDVLMVDYLGLVAPNGSISSDSNMYETGSVVAKELRALSYKFGIPVITAVQCNTGGFNTADISMGNIAESRAIAHHTDFLAGLYQTEDEQADGIFHMKILKSRLGDRGNLKFDFNKNTMEFTDINDMPDNAGTGDSTISSADSKILPKFSDADLDPFGADVGMV